MKKLLTTTAFLTSVFAFDNEPGWKLDADGKIELKDGNPIYVDSAGGEMTVGKDTISKLNGEAKAHREAKEEALEKLKKFEGLDPEKVRDAMEKLSKIDQKKLIDSGEVDKVKDEIKGQFTEQLGEKDKEIETLRGQVDSMSIDKVFDGSEFVRNDIALSPDIFRNTFAKNFKVEEGKVTAYDNHGNRLMSKERAGEYATPEEALRILVNSRADKDSILKADAGSGSGGSQSGGMRGGQRTVKRSDMEKMTPAQQAEIAGKAGRGEINIVD